jgi:hypothetical protein
MGKPTREDAMLLVQLAQLQSSQQHIEGAADFMSREFPKTHADLVAKFPDRTGPTWRALGQAAVFYETVATLVRRELFSEELCHDWIWTEGIWRALAPAVEGWRTETGEPRLYENFEWLAKRAGA